ncbi:glycosyltransferase family 4 protein [Winogradskyella psychrotolerans]|uniref:glycosyltransferase family 4 protein n=1 Tax=Winogradskyella psychrotolerans TaxID=1344585 RepID=UPI001C06786B|nr:glycosyltransferase family 4 protein [Winogradskyella psychrotolerans]MBU2928370.1 glycosyltransferase family 4 protein [Winogradskyella psychrotolerans]
MERIKKKIAFVIGGLTPGGAERVITNLSNSLSEDFDVTIITFIETAPFYKLNNSVKVISCFKELPRPKSFIDSLKLNYNILKKVSKIAKLEKIDLLIGFITQANIKAVLAAKLNRIPCLISERNDPLKSDIPRFWVILRKFIYPKANCLIVQTEKVKQVYNQMLKSKEIVVLPNPISTELSQLRRAYSTNRENIILSVGTFNDDKRQEKIIYAFHNLKLSDWKLVLIGDGPNKSKLITLIKELNLAHKVQIVSKVKNVHDYYNIAKIFAFASKAEGFPNVLLEAMHYGLPSLSTDCNYGPSELIIDGKNGFLVPVDNQAMFVEKLGELVNNEDLQMLFSIKSKETTKKFLDSYVSSSWKNLILRHLT